MQVVITINQLTARGDITLRFVKHKGSKDTVIEKEAGECFYDNLVEQFSSIKDCVTTKEDIDER